MADFEPVQALLLEEPDLSLAAVGAQVRRDGEAADRVHELRHLLQGGERLLHVAGAAPAEVTVERLADVRAHAALDQHAGYVRPPQRAAVRGGLDLAHLDADPELAPTRDPPLGAATAGPNHAGQEFPAAHAVRIGEVAEAVPLAPPRLPAGRAA